MPIQRDFYVTAQDSKKHETLCSHARTHEIGSCIHLHFTPLAELPEGRPTIENINWITRKTLCFDGWYSCQSSDPSATDASTFKACETYNQNVKKVVVHCDIPHTRQNRKKDCSWELLAIPITALCLEIFPHLQKESCELIVYKELTSYRKELIFEDIGRWIK